MPRIMNAYVHRRLSLTNDEHHREAIKRAGAGSPATTPGTAVPQALEYPYASQPGSFIYIDGEFLELSRYVPENPGHSVVAIAGGKRRLSDVLRSAGIKELSSPRAPLIAYGANASVGGLKRKLRELAGEEAVLPAVAGHLVDFDAVYSAHLTSYGAVPATLQVSPATRVRVFIIYVTDRQLTALAVTEFNYRLAYFPTARIETAGSVIESAYGFVSRYGCLSLSCKMVAVKRIPAQARRFEARTEQQALEGAMSHLGYLQSVDTFIAEAAADHRVAIARSKQLKANAAAFAGDASWYPWRERS